MQADLISALPLALAMFAAATLYSSVGHGGASAYLGLMALAGIAPLTMRPTALVLNLAVASLAALRFIRAGLFRWRTLWPFLVGALPFAFIGGGIHLPGDIYRPLVGVVLWVSAARLLWPAPLPALKAWRDPPIVLALAAGAAIGLLSGLTGTGGGIFLSPLLLFAAWSEPKAASGAAAIFIVANSAAGLAGNLASTAALPPALPLYLGAVVLGAVIGTTIGIRVARARVLRLLGAVLVVAGAKLVLG